MVLLNTSASPTATISVPIATMIEICPRSRVSSPQRGDLRRWGLRCVPLLHGSPPDSLTQTPPEAL
jgi:hypothetical protein